MFLQLEDSSDKFKVISDKMTHWYEIMNTIIITINFSNAMRMNCAFMFLINNHHGRKCLSIFKPLGPLVICLNSFMT